MVLLFRACDTLPGCPCGAEDWLGRHRTLWEQRLDRLDAYLIALKEKHP